MAWYSSFQSSDKVSNKLRIHLTNARASFGSGEVHSFNGD